MLVTARRAGVAADLVGVAAVAPPPAPLVSLVLLVLSLPVLALLLIAWGLTLPTRTLALFRRLTGRLTDLSFAGLYRLVATAWRVGLMARPVRVVRDVLVGVVPVATAVVLTLALLALMRRVCVAALVVSRFVVGTAVIS